MEMLSLNTYARIVKAVAILKKRLLVEKLPDEKLNQIMEPLDLLYKENQRLREALKQNAKEYNRHYILFKREYHSMERLLQKQSPDDDKTD